MLDTIDDGNFTMFAMQHYDNPTCFDEDEFHEDMKRFKYLKRLLNRYIESGDLKERLILNHLTILNNVFGPDATAKMLVFKLEEYLPILKPFMVLLAILPDRITGVRGKDLIVSDVPLDVNIVRKLREL